MDIKPDKVIKKIVIIGLIISLSLNLLYLFDLIDFKIDLKPKSQELRDKTFYQFWDSPIIDTIIRSNIDTGKIK